MKRFSLLTALLALALPALADTEAGITAISDLGRLNGQALACSQMSIVGQARKLMIEHAPKTRRYGELFEDQTSAAFLAQGKSSEVCPVPEEFADRLREISLRLQTFQPAPQPAAR